MQTQKKVAPHSDSIRPANKVKTWLIILICLAATAIHSQTNYFSIINIGTNTFHEATLKPINALECLITDDTGWHKIAFSNLPPNIQKQYGYNHTNAIALAAQRGVMDKKISAEQAALRAKTDILSRIKIEYDKVDEYYSFEPYEWVVDTESGLEFKIYTTTDQEHPKPTKFILHIVSTSEDWKYLSYHRFVIVADGEKYEISDPSEDSDVLKHGGVIEQFSIPLKPALAAQLASARTVTGKLGTTTYTLDYASRQPWRDLANYFAMRESGTNTFNLNISQ